MMPYMIVIWGLRVASSYDGNFNQLNGYVESLH